MISRSARYTCATCHRSNNAFDLSACVRHSVYKYCIVTGTSFLLKREKVSFASMILKFIRIFFHSYAKGLIHIILINNAPHGMRMKKEFSGKTAKKGECQKE